MGLRSLVVLGAVGAAVLLVAPPAFAEPAGADVEFNVAGNTVVQNAGKPVWVQLFNNGPETAENIVVKVDISGVDTDKVDVQVPAGCSDPDGGIFLCGVGSLVPGEANTLFSPFDIVSVDGHRPGGFLHCRGHLRHRRTPRPGTTRSRWSTLTVKEPAYDFNVIVQDIWAELGGEPNRVTPGDTAPLVDDVLQHRHEDGARPGVAGVAAAVRHVRRGRGHQLLHLQRAEDGGVLQGRRRRDSARVRASAASSR